VFCAQPRLIAHEENVATIASSGRHQHRQKQQSPHAAGLVLRWGDYLALRRLAAAPTHRRQTSQHQGAALIQRKLG
jgi:hypothetical protein